MRPLPLERIMDLKLLDPVITFLTWVGHAIVYAGAGIFLLVAAWCFVMEAIAILAVVLKGVLEYARERTAHARDALREVRAQLRS
jgi:membrane protein implicated in regulation of membrane protease activity